MVKPSKRNVPAEKEDESSVRTIVLLYKIQVCVWILLCVSFLYLNYIVENTKEKYLICDENLILDVDKSPELLLKASVIKETLRRGRQKRSEKSHRLRHSRSRHRRERNKLQLADGKNNKLQVQSQSYITVCDYLIKLLLSRRKI